MSTAERHSLGLSNWHRCMLALAVAAQGFALAQTCPWLHPAWRTTLTFAASVAALPVVHARRFAVALASSLSLTVVVFSVLGTAVGALVGALEWTRADGGGWSLTRLVAAAVWWWALHVPVVVMRWRTQAMPADNAAREVVAALGASLLATAGLLVTTSAASWWATVGCVALTVAALKWAWRKHSDEVAAAARSAQPGEGRGAPYRAHRSLTPAKMSWGRWALFWAMVAWCGAVVRWGAWRLPHVGPRGQWAAVATAMRTVRVGEDPCGVGLGPEARREFTWRYGTSESVTVWPSGAVTFWPSGAAGDCGGAPSGRCIPIATARGLLARASDAQAVGYAEVARIARAPSEWGPVVCAAGRWCSISSERDEGVAGHCGSRRRLSCKLRLDGEFGRGSEGGGVSGYQTGRIPAATARSLIAAVEAAALARGPLLMHSWTEERGDDGDLTSTSELLPPVFVVGVGPAEARYRIDFPQARAIEALLWQRLCNALPEQEDWSPGVLIQLPDDP